MRDDVQAFYDQLAADYHLIFTDWEAAIAWNGEVIDGLLQAEIGPPPHHILDCACGIGTQALGLAGRGYSVHATDLSPVAVERAAAEAAQRGLSLQTAVADMRTLHVEGAFDAVLAFDNALPHLLTEDDLAQAARAIHARLRPGGVFMASIRDYDHVLKERPTFLGERVLDEGRRIVFQVWGWHPEAPQYTVNQFILQCDDDDVWHTRHVAAQYWALQRDELTRILEGTGFESVRWDLETYYQPLVIARR